jgi:hypothetical protein
MLQLELLVKLPLIELRDLQHHEVVRGLMHLVLPKLVLASLLLEQELQLLLQLRERLVESARERQVLELQQRELMLEQKLPNSVLAPRYLVARQPVLKRLKPQHLLSPIELEPLPSDYSVDFGQA